MQFISYPHLSKHKMSKCKHWKNTVFVWTAPRNICFKQLKIGKETKIIFSQQQTRHSRKKILKFVVCFHFFKFINQQQQKTCIFHFLSLLLWSLSFDNGQMNELMNGKIACQTKNKKILIRKQKIDSVYIHTFNFN